MTETIDTFRPALEDLRQLRDDLRVRGHLLAREALDLLASVESGLARFEHRMRHDGAARAELAAMLHELHEGLGRLRARLDGEPAAP